MSFDGKRAHEILKEQFGYDEFRPQQLEIIERAFEGGDTVVLMPTGGGKSICYQLTALMLNGLTIVVSPLIALMKDQVQALVGNGIQAAFLNSSLSSNDEREIHAKLSSGTLKLLYVSPERLLSNNFLHYLKGLNVALFAIDEAHCISSWGHHFRPEYKRLALVKKEFPETPMMALTATADKAVRSDISVLLEMNNAQYFVSSFDRPNIKLSVLPGRKKWEQILSILNRFKGEAGIIYCISRKNTEMLSEKLQNAGINAAHYHARMSPDERNFTQDAFINDKIDIVCATVAFGMGIDKSNVRFVIHYNMPGNLEGYYQEIGRGGRDGVDSEAVLFYSYRDVQVQMSFIEEVEDPQYKKIQEAKLDRMQEYAEAQVCRRKILLSYFSETPGTDCNNCDVCQNPPEFFDGTKMAQMALSACFRVKEQVGIGMLVDILRGSRNRDILANGFDKVKTFGVGYQTSSFAWLLFVQQLVQQGFLELDYKDKYRLKLTELSNEVLFKGRQVKLVSPDTIKKRQEEQKKTKIATKIMVQGDADPILLEALKQLRKKIAVERGQAPYMVFHDNTLKDMALKLPHNYDSFLGVSGVGTFKADEFSQDFISLIDDFRADIEPAKQVEVIVKPKKRKPKGASLLETKLLFDQGFSLDEIAMQRELKESTILSHLATLAERGEALDFDRILTATDRSYFDKAFKTIGDSETLRPYFDYLDGQLSFGKLKILMAERNGNAD